jgi:ArsR family transcriptional regulator, arsenate/arsenite/antimonite-responsive transcriptional repressor
MKAADINRVFRAFSDPIRLRTLHLLLGGEMCVGDLVEVLRVPQPTASRHLRYLREAGLVQVRRDGRWSFYSLTEAGSGFHGRLLDCLADCFGEVPELKNDAARAGRLREKGGCCAADPNR